MDALARIKALAAANGLHYLYSYVEGEHHGELYDDRGFYAVIVGSDESAEVKLNHLEATLSAYLRSRYTN